MSLCSLIHGEIHRVILDQLGAFNIPSVHLLDVGCWDGTTTVAYADVLGAGRMLGVEVFERQACQAEKRGITVARVDLEGGIFPWSDASVDVVVCNQVFEHLKDVFRPLDEIARVLKPAGRLVISVPNLASLHNRLMLALGMQPTSIRTFGPHVRGFAKREFEAFLLTGGVFELERVVGVGFYPFPPKFGGRLLGRLWRDACHTPVWVLRRSSLRNFSFAAAYHNRSEQTLM